MAWFGARAGPVQGDVEGVDDGGTEGTVPSDLPR
jgi:hypothetical protein